MLPGPQLFLRYAFAPNHLGLCGGDDNSALFEYGVTGCIDGGLINLARQFEGAYPYLQLIAQANAVEDPLDARVVEAYWIGNSLLDRVDMWTLGTSLTQRFKPRLNEREWRWLADKPLAGAKPHHSMHVLEVYPRIGLMRSGAVDALVHNIDRCCIRWGKVQEAAGANLIVQARPMVLERGKLALGPPRLESVTRWVDGRGFVDDLVAGEWVAIHWGWACDRLLPHQRANLERYTRRHIAICNATF
jgi:hypothetical protein